MAGAEAYHSDTRGAQLAEGREEEEEGRNTVMLRRADGSDGAVAKYWKPDEAAAEGYLDRLPSHSGPVMPAAGCDGVHVAPASDEAATKWCEPSCGLCSPRMNAYTWSDARTVAQQL